MANELQGKAKNLGQVAAMVFRSTAPSNLKVLWYNTSTNVIMKYDIDTSAWAPLGGYAQVETISNAEIDALT